MSPWHRLRHICAAGGILVAHPSLAQEQVSTSPCCSDDIVVIGRKPVGNAEVVNSVSSSVIKGYGADTIGEVLERIRARLGDRPLNVLVNGRRLLSLESVASLPPEALAQIDVLTASAGLQRGVAADNTVVNLVLRQHFDFLSLEGSGVVPTEPGGAQAKASTRFANIRGDKRINAVISYFEQSGLNEANRVAPGGSADTDGGGIYRSLLPVQKRLETTGGYAVPFGQSNLDISVIAGVTHSDMLAGLVTMSGFPGFSSAIQQTDERDVSGTASFSRSASRFFLSMQIRTGVTDVVTRYARRPIVGEGLNPNAARQAASQLGDDVHSRSSSVELSGTVSGSLFNLPGGPATLDLQASSRLTWVTTAVEDARISSAKSDTTTTLTGNLVVPLIRRSTGFGMIGDLALTQGFSYIQVSSSGSAIGRITALNWTPVAPVLITVRRELLPSLPPAMQRFAPITSRSSVLFYDGYSREIAPIIVIQGGIDAARITRNAKTAISAATQGTLGAIRLGGSITYSVDVSTNPLVTLDNPSPLAQQIFADRFQRDVNGTLTQFDARPFYGRQRSSRTLSLDLNIAGVDKVADAKAMRRHIIWDASLSYACLLADDLERDGRGGRVDLIRNPLSLNGGSQSTDSITARWSASISGFGLNGSAEWHAGMRLSPSNSGTDATVDIKPLTKIDLDGFVDLARAEKEDDPSGLRLSIGVTNVLNQRPRIVGLPGANERLQSVLLDPIGRTVRLSLRKAF